MIFHEILSKFISIFDIYLIFTDITPTASKHKKEDCVVVLKEKYFLDNIDQYLGIFEQYAKGEMSTYDFHGYIAGAGKAVSWVPVSLSVSVQAYKHIPLPFPSSYNPHNHKDCFLLSLSVYSLHQMHILFQKL